MPLSSLAGRTSPTWRWSPSRSLLACGAISGFLAGAGRHPIQAVGIVWRGKCYLVYLDILDGQKPPPELNSSLMVFILQRTSVGKPRYEPEHPSPGRPRGCRPRRQHASEQRAASSPLPPQTTCPRPEAPWPIPLERRARTLDSTKRSSRRREPNSLRIQRTWLCNPSAMRPHPPEATRHPTPSDPWSTCASEATTEAEHKRLRRGPRYHTQARPAASGRPRPALSPSPRDKRRRNLCGGARARAPLVRSRRCALSPCAPRPLAPLRTQSRSLVLPPPRPAYGLETAGRARSSLDGHKRINASTLRSLHPC